MSKLLEVLTNHEAATLPIEQVKPPDNITGNCVQCGKCCEFYNCPLWDKVNKVCSIYNNRPVACRMWPHRQSDIMKVGCPGFTQVNL